MLPLCVSEWQSSTLPEPSTLNQEIPLPSVQADYGKRQIHILKSDKSRQNPVSITVTSERARKLKLQAYMAID
jgi:hypothetical protein